MNTTEKSNSNDDASDSSSINRLPDELILQILNKLIDLKPLCFCRLVSTRFSSIVLQADTISFIAPLFSDQNTSNDSNGNGFPNKLFWSLINGVILKPIHLLRRMVVPSSKPLPPIISSFYGENFRSAVSFLSKFVRVKNLSIELPCSNHRGVDNSCLFKWKVKFGNRIESFLFLSPNELYVNRNIIEEQEDIDLTTNSSKQKIHIAFQCLKDVILRHRMLLYFIKDFPSLEKVSITDSGRRGTLSLSGGRVRSARENVKLIMNRIEVPVDVSQWYVPVLNLPVSGCVMKGVSLVVMHMNDVEGGNDWFMNGGDGFENEGEVEGVYCEAVMEILENHRDKMKRLL